MLNGDEFYNNNKDKERRHIFVRKIVDSSKRLTSKCFHRYNLKFVGLVLVGIIIILVSFNFKFRTISRPVIELETAAAHPNDSPVAICVIQKGALFYLDEWTDFHLALGFDTIFIYDNSDNFELKEWAKSKGIGSSIIVRHYPGGKGVQKKAYIDCFERIKENKSHDWIAFIDADEFIVLKQHEKISELLATVPTEAGGLTISWYLFGCSGHTKYAPLPALKRFQMREKRVHELNKTIARTSKLVEPFYHNHYYKDGVYAVDTSGRKVKGLWYHFKNTNDVAAIHHYRTKSWEEFRSKCKRGRASQGIDIHDQNYQVSIYLIILIKQIII